METIGFMILVGLCSLITGSIGTTYILRQRIKRIITADLRISDRDTREILQKL